MIASILNKENITALAKRHVLVLAAIILGAIAFYPTLENGLLFWDDHTYVLENELIKDFSIEGIHTMFAKHNVLGHYQPITLLSYAIDYKIGGTDPAVYHQHNLLLHLLNTFLVYVLSQLLLGKRFISVVIATLFAVHPMHTESIAWVSERKDLLYSSQYLAGLICYWLALKRQNLRKILLAATSVFFVISLLSKTMAMTFPAILVLLDYFHHNSIKEALSKSSLLKKAPYFLLSAIFAYIALKSQALEGAVNTVDNFSMIDRVATSSFATINYIIKSIIPFDLSGFHPYPNDKNLPLYMWLSPFGVLGILYIIYKYFRDNKFVIFGFGFFFISVLPVLQLVSVGSAMMSDRYSYLPYLGLFIILAYYLNVLREKLSSSQQNLLLGGIVIYSLILAQMSWTESKVWKNDNTLWTDVVQSYPNAHFALVNLGDYAFYHDQDDEAIQYYREALKQQHKYLTVHNNLGLIYKQRNRPDSALANYQRAIDIGDYPIAHLNKGVLYFEYNQDSLAIAAYSEAIRSDSSYALAYLNRANAFFRSKNYEATLADLNAAKKHGENRPELYLIEAKTLNYLGRTKEAIATLISLKQRHYELPVIPYELALLQLEVNQPEQALINLDESLAMVPKNLDILVAHAKCQLYLDQPGNALGEINNVLEVDSTNYNALHTRAIIHQHIQQYDKSLFDFDRALYYSQGKADIKFDLLKLMMLLEQWEVAHTLSQELLDMDYKVTHIQLFMGEINKHFSPQK